METGLSHEEARKLKNIKKKITQCEALLKRQENGEKLTNEEVIKLSKYNDMKTTASELQAKMLSP